MRKINEQKLLEETKKIIDKEYPNFTIRGISLKSSNSYFVLVFRLEGLLTMEIEVDLMDSFLSYQVIRLDKEGKPLQYGYYSDKEGRPMRVSFQKILNHLQIPFDKKHAVQLGSLKTDFYLKEDCNEYLKQKINDGLLFYAPIFKNDQSIISQLQEVETWDKLN